MNHIKYLQKGVSLALSLSLLFYDVSLGSAQESQGMLAPLPLEKAHSVEKLNLDLNPSLKELQIPSEFGEVIEREIIPDRPLLFIIEDIHCNPEAQENIKRILEILEKQVEKKEGMGDGGRMREEGRGGKDAKELESSIVHRPSSLFHVFSEGAEGPMELSFFTAFPDKDALARATEKFLQKSDMDGVESFLVTEGPGKTEGVGVEDLKAYVKNVEYMGDFLEEKELQEHVWQNLEMVFRKLREKIYSKALKFFFEQKQKYSDFKIDLTTYIQSLEKIYQETFQKKFGAEKPFLRRYLKLNRLETRLDSSRIEQEYLKFLETLEKKLPQEESALILRHVLERRLGRESDQDHYTFLSRYAHLVKGAEIPNLKLLFRQMKLLKKLSWKDLEEEIHQVEAELTTILTKTEQEKNLVALEGDYEILKRIMSLEGKREDIKTVYRHSSSVDRTENRFVTEFVAKLKTLYLRTTNDEQRTTAFESPDFGDIFEKAEKFYSQVLDRDEIFMKNALHVLQEKKLSYAALVMGGFHTSGVEETLKKAHIGYCVITPRMTHSDDRSVYYQKMKEIFEVLGGMDDGLKNASFPTLKKIALHHFMTQAQAMGRVMIEEARILPKGFFDAWESKAQDLASVIEALEKSHPESATVSGGEFTLQTLLDLTELSAPELRTLLQDNQVRPFLERYIENLLAFSGHEGKDWRVLLGNEEEPPQFPPSGGGIVSAIRNSGAGNWMVLLALLPWLWMTACKGNRETSSTSLERAPPVASPVQAPQSLELPPMPASEPSVSPEKVAPALNLPSMPTESSNQTIIPNTQELKDRFWAQENGTLQLSVGADGWVTLTYTLTGDYLGTKVSIPSAFRNSGVIEVEMKGPGSVEIKPNDQGGPFVSENQKLQVNPNDYGGSVSSLTVGLVQSKLGNSSGTVKLRFVHRPSGGVIIALKEWMLKYIVPLKWAPSYDTRIAPLLEEFLFGLPLVVVSLLGFDPTWVLAANFISRSLFLLPQHQGGRWIAGLVALSSFIFTSIPIYFHLSLIVLPVVWMIAIAIHTKINKGDQPRFFSSRFLRAEAVFSAALLFLTSLTQPLVNAGAASSVQIYSIDSKTVLALKKGLSGIGKYLSPQVGIHRQTGAPQDSVQINSQGNMIGSPANYGAPSKDATYLPLLLHLAQGNPLLSDMGVTRQQALNFALQELQSLRQFQRDYEGTEIYAGFFPWNEYKEDGSRRLSEYGGRRMVPSLDNGQLSFALASIAGAFWNAQTGTLEKQVQDLAVDILNHQDYGKLVNPQNGLLYAEWDFQRHGQPLDSRMGTLWTEWSIPHLFALWSGKIKEESWARFTNPTFEYHLEAGRVIDMPQGWIFSAHELWYLQYVPRLIMKSKLAPLYRNYLYLHAQHAIEKNMPGFVATEYKRSGYKQGGIDVPKKGHGGEIRSSIDDETMAAPYGTALLSLIDLRMLPWVQYLFEQPGVVQRYGPVTSFTRAEGASNMHTADNTFSTANALAEGCTIANNLPGGVEAGIISYFKNQYGLSEADLIRAFNLHADLILKRLGLSEFRAVQAAEIPLPPEKRDYSVEPRAEKKMPDAVNVMDRLKPQGGWYHGKNIHVPAEYRSWASEIGQTWVMKKGEIVADYQISSDTPWAWLGTKIEPTVSIGEAKYISLWVPVDLRGEIWKIELKNSKTELASRIQVNTDDQGVETSADGKWKRLVYPVNLDESLTRQEGLEFNYFALSTEKPSGRFHIRDIQIYKNKPVSGGTPVRDEASPASDRGTASSKSQSSVTLPAMPGEAPTAKSISLSEVQAAYREIQILNGTNPSEARLKLGQLVGRINAGVTGIPSGQEEKWNAFFQQLKEAYQQAGGTSRSTPSALSPARASSTPQSAPTPAAIPAKTPAGVIIPTVDELRKKWWAQENGTLQVAVDSNTGWVTLTYSLTGEFMGTKVSIPAQLQNGVIEVEMKGQGSVEIKPNDQGGPVVRQGQKLQVPAQGVGSLTIGLVQGRLGNSRGSVQLRFTHRTGGGVIPFLKRWVLKHVPEQWMNWRIYYDTQVAPKLEEVLFIVPALATALLGLNPFWGIGINALSRIAFVFSHPSGQRKDPAWIALSSFVLTSLPFLLGFLFPLSSAILALGLVLTVIPAAMVHRAVNLRARPNFEEFVKWFDKNYRVGKNLQYFAFFLTLDQMNSAYFLTLNDAIRAFSHKKDLSQNEESELYDFVIDAIIAARHPELIQGKERPLDSIIVRMEAWGALNIFGRDLNMEPLALVDIEKTMREARFFNYQNANLRVQIGSKKVSWQTRAQITQRYLYEGNEYELEATPLPQLSSFSSEAVGANLFEITKVEDYPILFAYLVLRQRLRDIQAKLLKETISDPYQAGSAPILPLIDFTLLEKSQEGLRLEEIIQQVPGFAKPIVTDLNRTEEELREALMEIGTDPHQVHIISLKGDQNPGEALIEKVKALWKKEHPEQDLDFRTVRFLGHQEHKREFKTVMQRHGVKDAYGDDLAVVFAIACGDREAIRRAFEKLGMNSRQIDQLLAGSGDLK
ncbi:MAG: hypothetical protein HYS08_08395, partial [Chlamydiae bacterium]|nr:hypothetical protein [Chlamydiota bacterium]